MANILSIVPYKIFPAKLGGQKGIALFNEYLSKETSLVAVTVKSNDPVYVQGYTLLNILSDSSLRYINPAYFFTIRKIIRQHKITHLILEHPYYGWLGVLLKWFTGVDLIIHSHNIESTRWKSLHKWWWKILWYYEKYTHAVADHNFFIQDDDRDFAINNFKLDPEKCSSITYGIEWDKVPLPDEKKSCKALLHQQYDIPGRDTILLFNGTLDYKPNLDAVNIILEKINPLLSSSGFSYKIIICGRGLPERMNELKAYTGKNIIYAGFVDDITIYFKGADIFINPVVDGGGIKTKLVEALGYNMNAVTTESGAIGIPVLITGTKMHVVEDNNWESFTEKIIVTDSPADIPIAFFNNFYWGKIATKAVQALTAKVKS